MHHRRESNMISIPYRVRRFLRNFAVTALVTALVAAVLILLWILWLSRYLVYTRDGAVLNFNISLEMSQGEAALSPDQSQGVDIYYNEGDDAIDPITAELKQLSGYSVSAELLQGDISALSAQLEKLPAGTAILLEVKSSRGDFYYDSGMGPVSEAVDAQAVEAMIAKLKGKGYYLIARVPAFQDYWHGLNNVDQGLFNLNRYSLWLDGDRCYWLDPTAEATLTYLRDILSELRELGFQEAVFTQFCFPDTDKIYFQGDKAQAIADAAQLLVKTCASDSFAVSFSGGSADFPLPEGRSRLYLTDVSAAEAANAALQTGLSNPAARLVFLTDLRDTRFDDYGVLRPLSAE